MKAIHLLFASPILLLFGGCLEPIPFDHPNYPRNSELRYPPGTVGQQQQSRNYNNQRNYPTDNRWNRPSSSSTSRNTTPEIKPRPQPKPTPQPKPRPKPPESRPLVDIDPIAEAEKEKFPYALPVDGATNLVVSPYAKDGPYIDVSGLSSGTQIECNKTGKTILVP